MNTVLDLINASLRKLESLAGESATIEEAEDARTSLNLLLGTWGTMGYVVPTTTWRKDLALPAGVSSRTIGLSGDYGGGRPFEIRKAFLRDSSSFDNELDIKTFEQYQELTDKAAPGRPTRLYYHATFPLGTLYFHPVAQEPYTLFLLTHEPLTEYAAVNDPLNVSPEYKRLFLYNLCVELAPEYGVPLEPSIAVLAKRTLQAVMRVRAAAEARTVPVATELQPSRFSIFDGGLG